MTDKRVSTSRTAPVPSDRDVFLVIIKDYRIIVMKILLSTNLKQSDERRIVLNDATQKRGILPISFFSDSEIEQNFMIPSFKNFAFASIARRGEIPNFDVRFRLRASWWFILGGRDVPGMSGGSLIVYFMRSCVRG